MDIFNGKEVLVTGGLGFIGSNLAIRLLQLGAQVTIVDAMIKGHGGNLFNIETIKKEVKVNFCDIRDNNSLRYLIEGKDYLFHLAGQNDHVLSQTNPFPDIEHNIKGSAVILETCRNFNTDIRIVYTGTRGEYGPAINLPVNEDAALKPKGIYELSSLTAQKMFEIYHKIHGINSVTLRLTNIYGERAQMQHNRFGVANWFVRLALDNQVIKVFGEKPIMRDFLYVDDAVNAILMCAANEEAYGKTYNVGHNNPSSFLELAKIIIKISKSGSWKYAPFSPERAALEPGDFYSDISKIKTEVGWEPQTSLEQGISKSVEYYRNNKKHYW
jgi:UDP-glucose 4-epimerase